MNGDDDARARVDLRDGLAVLGVAVAALGVGQQQVDRAQRLLEGLLDALAERLQLAAATDARSLHRLFSTWEPES